MLTRRSCDADTELGDMKKRLAEDPEQFDELPRKLLRVDVPRRASKVYAECVKSVVGLVSSDKARAQKVNELTKDNRVLKSNKQAAQVDEHVDGQIVHTLKKMLNDRNVSDAELMAFIFSENRETWTEDRQLRRDISLSIADFFDQMGAGSLTHFNEVWNAANPEVPAVVPPAVLSAAGAATVAVAVVVDGVAQGPLLALPGGVLGGHRTGVVTRASARVSASGSSGGSSGGTIEAGVRRGEAMARAANDVSSGGSLN